MKVAHCLLVLLLAGSAHGAARGRPAEAPPAASQSNAEMRRMFEADQAPRKNPASIDWNVLAKEDEQRRARAKALLDARQLKSADDFYHAAFVFQHGTTPNDFLLAHNLAVIAATKGRAEATWIAAATLDRYLQSIGQKQIFGTQFSTPPGQPTTQEPYDRTLVSDALRAAMGVPAQHEQEKRRAQIEARYRAREAAGRK